MTTCNVPFSENYRLGVLAAYGKIPENEYRIRHEKLSVKHREFIPETLREDYCIGVDAEGKFSLNYSCRCDQCGFKFKHKFEKQL